MPMHEIILQINCLHMPTRNEGNSRYEDSNYKGVI